MAYDQYLSERIERVLKTKKHSYKAKEMFGGICFMLDHKMCIGVVKNDLMARVGPDAYELLVNKRGARPMDFTKRPMKGYLFIDPSGLDNEEDLDFWIDKCIEYNPKAKSSKK